MLIKQHKEVTLDGSFLVKCEKEGVFIKFPSL